MDLSKLRETLECPVCFHIRRGNVYQCKMGHSVRLRIAKSVFEFESFKTP